MRLRLLLFALALALVSLVFSSPAETADKQSDEYYKLFEIFVDSFEQIERNYVKEVDRRELIEAAIKGMVKQLDPYSSYISPEEYRRFSDTVEQQFGGIGIQVTMSGKPLRLTVATPLPGTPAYKAGVRAGDTIMEIEGKSTAGFDIRDAVKRLKGQPGTTVIIGVTHAGETEIEQIKIERAIIHVPTVLGDTYNPDGTWNFVIDDEKGIGYIRLSSFSRNSAHELASALETLKKQGMKSLILDLRLNPGGLLSIAADISDLFIEEGTIVSTKGRNTEERVITATKPGTYTDFPMVVLVNRFSASASEIVAACLQDHKRAVIIGERTWGKGSVQNVINLEGHKSALKLTTASYHRPSGKNIHRFPGAKDSDTWGVVPNEGFNIRFEDDELEQYQKFRLARDVLSKDGPPKSEFVDRQRQKGVEYLVAQLQTEQAAPVEETETPTKPPVKDEQPQPAAP